MKELAPSRRLNKEIGLFGVFAIATGTTLSAGFFLLPGLAAAEVGPAIVLCYLLAVIPLLPAMFSIVELATAMPRAGGVYYFLDRTMGPAVGTVGGLGTWLVLVLKVSFALVGIGAYLAFFWPQLPVKPVAVGLAVVLSILNLAGARKTGGAQIGLVVGLLLLLTLFIVAGMPRIEPSRFTGFLDAGGGTILATAGFVYISYIGITTVVSLSEEVKNPERNLPRGIFLTLGTSVLVYLLGTLVMVGVVPMEKLAGNLTPAAAAGYELFGVWGARLISVAALLAFTSVANAGILSASRYPLAMSRDHLMPRVFGRLGWHRIPFVSVAVTVAVIVLVLVTLDPAKIAKLASAFQLLMFALICLAVIVMRESRIEAYDPGYRSPFYPWMQIVGVAGAVFFMAQMGWVPMVFSVGLVILGLSWYRVYGRHRVARDGAIYHVFERLGQMRYEGLDRELRGILKEKGLRDEDPFDEIVARSVVIDLDGPANFEQLTDDVATALADRTPVSASDLAGRFLQGTQIGATPVTHGVALPHVRLVGQEHPEMVLVRAREGVSIRLADPVSGVDTEHTVGTLFFLVSPNDNPSLHLRILAQIAGRVDDEHFAEQWAVAPDPADLREVLLRDERFLSVRVGWNAGTAAWAGKALRDLTWVEGTLVALIHRREENIIPTGRTVLEMGDRVTILGEPEGIARLYELHHQVVEPDSGR